jgi:hypothetical protein
VNSIPLLFITTDSIAQRRHCHSSSNEGATKVQERRCPEILLDDLWYCLRTQIDAGVVVWLQVVVVVVVEMMMMMMMLFTLYFPAVYSLLVE